MGLARLVAVAVSLAAAVAHAQQLPRAEDKAEADRLFEEGRALLAQGNRVDACQRFALSLRKDPRAVGTMLNVALCDEEAGQIASAVRHYAEARDRAHDQQLAEHEQAARRKIEMLAPRVPRVVITGAPTIARVLVDDVVIDRDGLIDISVDPGRHVVVVTAPDKLPYELTFEIAESERRTLLVPPLEGVKTVIVHVTQSPRKLWAKLATGGGVVLAVVGIGVGLYARSYYWQQFPDGARDHDVARDPAHPCWVEGGDRKCNQVGSSRLDTARRLGHVATGAAIVGGLAVAVGGALWLTAPDRDRATAVMLDVASGGAGLVVRGSF